MVGHARRDATCLAQDHAPLVPSQSGAGTAADASGAADGDAGVGVGGRAYVGWDS